MTDVRYDVIGVWRIVMDARNSGVGVRSIVRDIDACDSLKFSLQVKCQQRYHRGDRTDIGGLKNPVQVQPPGSDRFTVGLLVEISRDRISFTPLDDIRLDLGHSAAIESFVIE